MLEQITDTFLKTNAKRVQQLREKRGELMKEMQALNSRIDRINVEIRDLMGGMTQRACDMIDAIDTPTDLMTREQAETIVTAMNSHRQFPRYDADYDPERFDGLS